MNLLDFRSLLCMIADIFGEGEFTARELNDIVLKAMNDFAKYPLLYLQLLPFFQRFRTKLISNDLRRLYAMGFLKRKRVKRVCRTKSGKVCFRGYEYKYSISSQGWKYLRYLREGEAVNLKLEDIIALKAIIKLPEDKQDLAWNLYKVYIRGGKGFNRFSTSKSAVWDKLVDLMWKEIRDEKVKKLTRRVEELEKKNRELEEENRILKESLMEVYRLLQGI